MNNTKKWYFIYVIYILYKEGGISLDKKEQIIPTEKEKLLLKTIRELGYGEIRIFVADSQPVRAEEIKKSIKF